MVNVEDLPQARISLFPNPTSGDLNLRLENSTHQISNIQLIGLDGRLISEFTVQQRDQAYFIPLHEMSMNNGLYFLQVKLTSGEKINKRFVIQR